MNVVFILSDRHTATFSGCYGNTITRTPNLNRLAERGVRFDNAYCLSPTCVPARASMLSGRYIHEIGTWCNSFPYTGSPEGWPHHFRQKGALYATIGKLDVSREGDPGIEEVHLPSYRTSRDVLTLFREDTQPRFRYIRRFCETGPADSLKAYANDIRVAEEAGNWIRENRPEGRPWVLSVNLKQLHRPWLPSQELWDHYDPLVRLEDLDERYTRPVSDLHPFQQMFARYSGGEYVALEDVRRGLAGYHAACEILDQNIGVVLDALTAEGILEDTLVVYSSDHAGNCGEHRALDHGGLTEESIRVPMIIAGPGIQKDSVVDSPVSVLDIFPTINESLGFDREDDKLGVSLMDVARGHPNAEVPNFALCQFHATGFPGSGFAIRSQNWKYVECVGERPMLFDLQNDPHELSDLASKGDDEPEVKEALGKMRKLLESVCSPEAVDAKVKADQRALRAKMAEDGSLLDELWSRGYERRTDRLIPQADLVMGPKPLV